MPETLDEWFRRVFLGHPPKPRPVRVRAIRDPDTEAVLGWFWTCDNNAGHRYGQPETHTAPTGPRAIEAAVEHVALHARLEELRVRREELRTQLGSKPL